MTSFLSREELLAVGFKSVGEHVYLSRRASIYGAKNITLGSRVRIDDFCILSGNITLGSYIHVAAYSALYGGESGILAEDFTNISSRNCIYAVSDDYSGETMTNPMVPEQYKNVTDRAVHIGKHVIIGSGCVVLPGATFKTGAAVGAMSLVKNDLEAFTIYAGVPARPIKKRAETLMELERRFLEEENVGKEN